MLEFLVDNIFVVFAGKVFQQIIGIPMGTNCAPLLADIFLYSYEAEFNSNNLTVYYETLHYVQVRVIKKIFESNIKVDLSIKGMRVFAKYLLTRSP